MKIEQHHRLPVAFWKRQHRPPDRIRALLFRQRVVLCGRSGWLSNLLQRHVHRRKPLQLRPKYIRRQRKQPSRESSFAPPSAQSPPRPDKSLLRQFLGASPVPAVAPRHIHQRPLPAPDNPLKRPHLASQHPLDIGQVFCRIARNRAAGTLCQLRPSPCSGTATLSVRLHFLRGKEIPQQNATAFSRLRSH